jgi:hypothetical protein
VDRNDAGRDSNSKGGKVSELIADSPYMGEGGLSPTAVTSRWPEGVGEGGQRHKAGSEFTTSFTGLGREKLDPNILSRSRAVKYKINKKCTIQNFKLKKS